MSATLLVMKTCSYVLTRGYSNIQKLRYFMIIARNWSIFFSLKKYGLLDTNFVFHEGNISKADKSLIQFFSPIELTFIDISEQFVVPNGFTNPPEKIFGYALMCRFQALDVWDHLRGYDVAIRLDEDCFLQSCPDPRAVRGFVTAAIEPDELSNDQIITRLKELNIDPKIYNQEFPYTNFLMTEPRLWNLSDVKAFSSSVMAEPNSLAWRWGDIPILGITINYFPAHFKGLQVDPSIKYFHLSHLTKVSNASRTENDLVLDSNRPWKTLVNVLRALIGRQ